jgi:hypothetical protein
MATTKTKPGIGVRDMLESAPRVAAALSRPGTIYYGACVVQTPGAWTRVGPTWLVPGLGWVTVGLGVRQWGTTAGLAELASQPTAKPTWHARGVSVVPAPNLVFAVTSQALASEYMVDVASMTRDADTLNDPR